MKRRLLLSLLLWSVAQTAFAAELSKDELLRSALSRNPTLKAARARWEAAKQRVPQARAWDDLMAGVTLERMGTLNPGKVTDTEWMVSQTLPVSGKNLSRARASEAEALSAFEEWRRARLEVITRAESAYDRLAAAYGQLEINRSNQELLKQITEISRGKYEVGTATQSDVLLAQTELDRLSERQALIQKDLSDQETQLNVLLNLPARTPVAHPRPLAFAPSPLASQNPETLAARCRPEVLAAWRKIEAEKARLQLAHRQWIPDPALQIKAREYPGRSGVQEYDTGITFSVPWTNFRKYSAGVAEAKANVESARAEYAAAQAEASGLVRDQLQKIDTAAANYRLFHDRIAPTARLSVEAARSGYETDKSSFLELLTAQRTLQDVDSAALAQLAEHQVATAELEAVVGVSKFLGPAPGNTSK
ncbi:MAG: TolC family protein [Chthoniobacteraceae bacterium]